MYVMKCVKLKLDKAQDVLLQMSETILSFQARNYMHGWVAYILQHWELQLVVVSPRVYLRVAGPCG